MNHDILLFIPNPVTNDDIKLVAFLFWPADPFNRWKSHRFQNHPKLWTTALVSLVSGIHLNWVSYQEWNKKMHLCKQDERSRATLKNKELALKTALLKPGCCRKYFQGLHCLCIVFMAFNL